MKIKIASLSLSTTRSHRSYNLPESPLHFQVRSTTTVDTWKLHYNVFMSASVSVFPSFLLYVLFINFCLSEELQDVADNEIESNWDQIVDR